VVLLLLTDYLLFCIFNSERSEKGQGDHSIRRESMKRKGRHQIWMTLGISCLLVISPCAGYGADLSIGNAMTINGDLIVTGSISEGGSGARNPLQIALLRWYGTNESGNTFDVGSTPMGIAFDGAHIWVGYGFANITKLRASDGSALGPYAAGSPFAVAFDGANVWVTSGAGNGVTKLKAADGSFLGFYSVGSYAAGVAFDGTNIWVANYGSDNVTKLRGSDGSVLGTYSVGNHPWGICFDGANIWVTNQGSGTVSKL
jgi:hypothetical protein